MTVTARQRVIEAAALVEALRPSCNMLLPEPSPEDLPIAQAWDKARAELRAACAAYILAGPVVAAP